MKSPLLQPCLRYAIIICFALMAFACKNKDKMAVESREAEPDSQVLAEAESDSLPDQVVDHSDSLVIALDKTPCFGRCPIYKVRIYRSGFATYEGINFVERMGLYSAQLSEQELEGLFAKAEQGGFYDFDEVYDDPRIQDFPSAILTFSPQGQKKKVTIRHEIPPDVKAFFEDMERRFDAMDWRPYSLR